MNRTTAFITVADSLRLVWSSFQLHTATTGGIKTPFAELNRLTGGIAKGRLWCIGAAPWLRTELALNFVHYAAIQDHLLHSSLLFSTTVLHQSVTRKLLALAAEVCPAGFYDQGFNHDERVRLNTATEMLQRAPIAISDTATLTINELQDMLAFYIRQDPTELVCLDGLQGLRVGPAGMEVLPEHYLPVISRLQEMASCLNVAMLVFLDYSSLPMFRNIVPEWEKISEFTDVFAWVQTLTTATSDEMKSGIPVTLHLPRNLGGDPAVIDLRYFPHTGRFANR